MYAVIMAGGGGTRLWPLSRRRRPKPFLPLLEGGRSLLEATVERLSPLIEPADTYVVTDARYAGIVGETAPRIPPANLVAEPDGRNTAAAVALAAHAIDRPASDVMVVLPADHAIRDEARFRVALEAAAERAAGGDIVTLGIQPTGPETGYGYVVPSGASEPFAGQDTYRVERFEEKPSPERAVALLAERASWNAGIFVWQRSTVLDGLGRYAPSIDEPIREWLSRSGRPRGSAEAPWPGRAMADVYAAIPAISIDYALLEPASLDGRVAVVPASIGWSDLGSWSAMREQRSPDGQAPVVSAEAPARVIEIDGRRVLVQASGGRLVAVVGIEDVVVVDTPDALLVASTEASQDVRKIVDLLKAEGRDDLL